MYSQQSSENPIRTKLRKFLHLNSQVNTPTSDGEASLLSSFKKPIKSVLAITMSIVLFVGFVMGAFCIEGSMDVGFKPDFQNQQKSYASVNTLFDQYTEMVTVKISVHGKKEFSVYTEVGTVADVIDKLSLTLDANDRISCPETEEVYDGMLISIDRYETKTHTETVTIPYSTKTISSDELPYGEKKVVQEGVNGSETQIVTETYINGILDSKEVTTDGTAVEPREEIVEVGAGGVYTDKYGNSYAYKYYIDVTATAYGTLSGVTATGKAIDYGMIAVDPSVIPLGTKVYLTGSWGDMGVHSAEDTGGAIKGNKIDVYLGDDYELLRQFGRRSMRVYILA